MLFRQLVEEYLAGTEAGDAINALVRIKESRSETDSVTKNDTLNTFIATEFDKLASRCPNECNLPDVGVFDDAFRQIIMYA